MTLAEAIPGKLWTRTDWGAPATPGGSYRNLDVITKTIYHWTTGTILGSSDQAKWVRSIYEYHTGSNGWADIGYNYLISRYGDVFVGRGRYRVGAHAPGANTDGMGIALLGGNSDALTREAKIAYNELIEWLADSVPRMTSTELGHGQVPGNSTSCPGAAVRNWVESGRPWPDGSEDDPDNGQPVDVTPDYVVAVIADNDIDEGMARVLGKSYLWKYLHADSLRKDSPTIGTAVRVGAARSIDNGPWNETHDVGGRDRDETATAVWNRIRVREGGSRSVE